LLSGPGGGWFLSPAEKHLGTIKAPELPANFAWVTTTAGRSTRPRARGSTASGSRSPASGRRGRCR